MTTKSAEQWDKDIADSIAAARANPDEPSTFPSDWSLAMILGFLAKHEDCGLGGVRALVKYCVNDRESGWDAEMLEDAVRELRGRNLGHVAAVVPEFIGDLPSSVENTIESAHQGFLRQPMWDRRSHRVGQWIHRRMAISGESWNTLVRKHDLSDWVSLKSPDLIAPAPGYFAKVDG